LHRIDYIIRVGSSIPAHILNIRQNIFSDAPDFVASGVFLFRNGAADPRLAFSLEECQMRGRPKILLMLSFAFTMAWSALCFAMDYQALTLENCLSLARQYNPVLADSPGATLRI
jgi:hypothetical protein